MKKLQIFMLYSMLALGFADDLQASWLGSFKEVKTADPKAGETNTGVRNESVQTKPTAAQLAADQNKKTQANDEAQQRMSAQTKTVGDQVAKLNTGEFTKSGPAPKSFSFFDASTWYSNGGKDKVDATTSESVPEAIRISNLQKGSLTQSQAINTFTNTIIEKAQNEVGTQLTPEQRQSIADNLNYTAQTWTEFLTIDGFSKWVKSCYDSILSYVSPKPAGISSGFNLSGDVTPSDSQQPSATGSVNLGTADAQADASAEQSVQPTNSATQDLFKNIRTTEQLTNTSSKITEGAKTGQSGMKQLLEQKKAENAKLGSWFNWGSSTPVAAV